MANVKQTKYTAIGYLLRLAHSDFLTMAANHELSDFGVNVDLSNNHAGSR